MQISSATRKKGCIQDIPASYYPGERDTEVQSEDKMVVYADRRSEVQEM